MRKIVCLSIVTLFTLYGCNKADSSMESSQLDGYVSFENVQWDDPMNIPICWMDEKEKKEVPEGSAYVNDKNKKLLEENANKSYAPSGIRFVGWKTCTDDFKGIRYQLRHAEWTGGSVSVIGSKLKETKNEDGSNAFLMIGKVKESLLSEEDKSRKEGDLYSYQYVVFNHELGHAIGLYHEMNRRDDLSCNYEDQTLGHGQMDSDMTPSIAAVSIGMPDNFSLMNYCFNRKKSSVSKKGELSKSDIATIKELYKKGSDNNPVVALFAVSFEPSLAEGYRLNLKLTSKNKFYRYKILKQNNPSLDVCADEKGYSEPISSKIAIDKLLTKKEGFEYKSQYRICVVGGDSDHIDESSVWQSFKEASQEIFIFESHVAYFKEESRPGQMSKVVKKNDQKVEIDVVSSNENTKFYRYKLGRADKNIQYPCKEMRSRWSEPLPIDKPIEIDARVLSGRDYIEFNICVVGGSTEYENSDNWQSDDGATRVNVFLEKDQE